MSRPGLSRRAFLKLVAGSALGTMGLGAGGVAYARRIEPGWVDLTAVRLTLPRLAPEFSGLRVVQLSDIHIDDWMTAERLGTIVRLVNAQAPDVVAITGDFVTYEPRRFAPQLTAALGALRPRAAAVATLGNHDHWNIPTLVRRVLRDAGIDDVSNGVSTLRRGAAMLHFGGIDDFMEGQDRLDLVLERLPGAGAAILLAHEPDFADISAATGRFDLQLSGHSHGGQVQIPLGGPPVVPRHAEKYPSGRYRVGGMIQYTNRGIGMVPPYVRFNCRPEVTVFTLETPRA